MAECDPVAGQRIVRFHPLAIGLQSQKASAFDEQLLKDRAFEYLHRMGADSVRFTSRNLAGLVVVSGETFNERALAELRDEGVILYDQPDCRVKPRRGVPSGTTSARLVSASTVSAVNAVNTVTPGDARYRDLWAFDNTGQQGGEPDMDINAPEAWNLTQGSGNVVVGILDGGVDFEHEDLRDNAWVNANEIPDNGIDDDNNGYVDDIHGANVFQKNGRVEDTSSDSHGSHGAGTIGATANNGSGVVGVSWNVRLMAINIFQGEEGGATSDILAAWDYALMMKRRGVNIRALNNSYGAHGENPGEAEHEMARALNAAGIVLVLSAGNDGANNDEDGDTSNLKTPNAINVAAVNRRGGLADFSNYGRQSVHLAAPGVGILSTIKNHGYASYDGTSQSAPMVTGIVALAVSLYPEATPEQIRARLMATVKRLSGLEGKMQAPGLVDAMAALNIVDGETTELSRR